MPFYGDVATVDRCQAKDLMREAYRAGGAPIPAFASVTSFAEVEAFVASRGAPHHPQAFARLGPAGRFESRESSGAA